MSAGAARTKMGGSQAVLEIRLKQFPFDSPKVSEPLTELTVAAWSVGYVAAFFEKLGFTYEDFALMYREMVRAAPVKIGRNYLATLVMVDRLSEDANARFFRNAADIVKMMTSAGRSKSEVLTDYIASCLKESGAKPGAN